MLKQNKFYYNYVADERLELLGKDSSLQSSEIFV